ncbi:MAG: GNAT family N-acetyltransferase [Clostridiales bacterium]|nr:GNAT family N-acetyltransferase [Clostridiales bacterium]
MMEHKGTINIETDRLLLRRFVLSDALPMFKNWANDSDVTTYLSWQPHENIEVSKNILNMWIDEYKSCDSYSWGIVLKDYGKVIGSIAVVNQNTDFDRCEVGYCIGKSFWGKGLMTEALKAVIGFLINKVGFNRVHAYHHAENIGSGKVMIKAGMKYEGCLREYVKNPSGIYTDCNMYSILKKELNP